MDKLDAKQFATNFTHFLYVLPHHAYGPPKIKEVKKILRVKILIPTQ